MPVTADAEISTDTVESLMRAEAVWRALELIGEFSGWITDRHVELTNIPAPTFGEKARGDYFLRLFEELKLERVRRDAAGNVLAELPGTAPARRRRLVLLTAHLDTVFPPGTRIEVRRGNGRIYAPGITDNGAGLAALLGVARAMRAAGLRPRDSIMLAATVGEEGEGNLFGIRQLLEQRDVRKAVRGVVVLDGADIAHIAAHGLGSRRVRVTVRGPGGHSWTDFGMANPIHALAAAICQFSATPVPADPRTTFNIGEIQGGTSVNSVPFCASMKVDIRSASAVEVRRLSSLLDRTVRQAVQEQNERARSGKLAYQIEEMGERPAADLPHNARLLESVRAVDRCLGIEARIERSSTDANIPLAMGIEAVSLGGGGQGGGIHSLQEWYDPASRELGLKRILLSLCAFSGIEGA
jgi:tripeptide aminopeptidase